MRSRAVISAVTATAFILVIGWQLGAQADDAAATTTNADDRGRDGGRMSTALLDLSDGPGRRGPGGRGPDAAADPAETPITAAALADGTYVGPPVLYPRGSVSVAVTVAGGVFTDVDAVIAAQNPVSRTINQRVEVLLNDAVLMEQSTDITLISGSTYTSQAYAASLQAALDEASS
jgi:uncharacterized protein with FMN-binding domain